MEARILLLLAWRKPTLMPVLSSSSMVLDTTLEEDSGLEVLCGSLASLPTGVKGEPEVPNTGKYPEAWPAEWRPGAGPGAGAGGSSELPGERKGEATAPAEARSSADRRSSWMWFCSCCSCCRCADCSAAE